VHTSACCFNPQFGIRANTGDPAGLGLQSPNSSAQVAGMRRLCTEGWGCVSLSPRADLTGQGLVGGEGYPGRGDIQSKDDSPARNMGTGTWNLPGGGCAGFGRRRGPRYSQSLSVLTLSPAVLLLWAFVHSLLSITVESEYPPRLPPLSDLNLLHMFLIGVSESKHCLLGFILFSFP
jgi:hypothetical protein